MRIFLWREVSWLSWIFFCNQVHAFHHPSQHTISHSSIKRVSGKLVRISGLNSLPPLIQILPDNQWGIYAAVAASAATALRLERKTKLGKSLSGPVTAMLLSAILTNIGVLPSEGSIYIVSLQGFVLKLATPMLLFGADLKKIFRETGVMLKAFLLGTVGTILGSFFGFLLMSGSMKNIGGLNFFAVADSLKLSPAALATGLSLDLDLNLFYERAHHPKILSVGLAVDNLLGLLYFPFISWLGAPYDENKNNSINIIDGNIDDKNDMDQNQIIIPNEMNDSYDEKINNSMDIIDNMDSIDDQNQIITNKLSNEDSQLEINEDIDEVEKMTLAIALGFFIAAIGESISKTINFPSIPISTLITVIIATIIPKQLKSITLSGELLGKLLLLLFFASIGNSSGTIASTFAAEGAGSLLIYELILYIVHIGFILSFGKLLKIPVPDILMASNANIGNAATASSFATAKGWKSRIVPGILVGTLGNAMGTFIGIFFGTVVLKRISGY